MTLREQIKNLVIAVAQDIKAIKTSITALAKNIGSVEELATQEKTSVVAAINEINTKAAAGVSPDALNTTVSTKVEEVIGKAADDNELVTLYTTTRDTAETEHTAEEHH